MKHRNRTMEWEWDFLYNCGVHQFEGLLHVVLTDRDPDERGPAWQPQGVLLSQSVHVYEGEGSSPWCRGHCHCLSSADLLTHLQCPAACLSHRRHHQVWSFCPRSKLLRNRAGEFISMTQVETIKRKLILNSPPSWGECSDPWWKGNTENKPRLRSLSFSCELSLDLESLQIKLNTDQDCTIINNSPNNWDKNWHGCHQGILRLNKTC